MTDHTATRPTSQPLPPALTGLAQHWGLVLAYAIVTLGLAISLLVWPDVTVTIFTVLLAIQLIIAGVFRIITAISMDRDGGVRALVGLSGGIGLIVGLLILRDPLQSVLVLGMVLGVFWLIVGVVDVLGALVAPPPEGRTGPLVTGLLSMAVGIFLVAYTDLSLKVLVVFVGIWLVAAGLLALYAAFKLRSMRPAV
jgi:uncharacterized membrane protein HdeD (DUF308 family)